MGQYFRIVNLDTREWFSPDDFDESIKDPNLSSKSMEALGALLMTSHRPKGFVASDVETFEPLPSGRWCGHRIAIIGDYSRDTFVVNGIPMAGSWLYEQIDEDPERWPNIANEIGGHYSGLDEL